MQQGTPTVAFRVIPPKKKADLPPRSQISFAARNVAFSVQQRPIWPENTLDWPQSPTFVLHLERYGMLIVGLGASPSWIARSSSNGTKRSYANAEEKAKVGTIYRFAGEGSKFGKGILNSSAGQKGHDN
jgi:hypothetical protein